MQRTMVFARLQLDAVNRAIECVDTASGKSINVARVAHTLGVEVFATGFLGGDTGNFIRADLAACGIANHFIPVTPKTRSCITILDQSTNQTTELVEEATQVEPQAWGQLRDTITNLLPRTKVFVLSGSLPPGAPQNFYAWCIANAPHARTILDAAGEPLRQALTKRPFLVKPNRSELAKTLGIPLDSRPALHDAIAHLNADWTLITQGKHPAILSNGKDFWRVESPSITAINPIGSGDSVAAGIACGLARNQDILDAITLGIAAGAANAMTKTAGVVHLRDVNQLLPQVRVTPL
jgi:tagatose 6-phosphate kinase